MAMDTKPVQKALLGLYRQMGSWAQVARATGFTAYGIRKMALGEASMRPESWDKLYASLPGDIPAPPWTWQPGNKVIEAAEQFAPGLDPRNMVPIPDGQPALSEVEREYLGQVLQAFRRARGEAEPKASSKPARKSS